MSDFTVRQIVLSTDDLATFVLSALTLLALRALDVSGAVPAGAVPGPARRSIRADLAQGAAAIWRKRWVTAVLSLDAVHILLAVAPWMALMPVLLTAEHGASGYGLLMSAFGGGALLGGLVSLRIRVRLPGLWALLAQWLFVGVLIGPTLQGMPLPALFCLYLLAGAGSELNSVLWTTALQHAYPTGLLGRINAFSSLGSSALMPVGLAVTGAFAGRVGTGQVMIVGAAVIVLSTLVVMPVKGVLHLADPDPVQTRAAESATT